MFGLSFDEERRLHQRLAGAILLISLPIFLVLLFIIPSPWGKTMQRKSWPGAVFPARTSWFLFECPNLIWTGLCLRQKASLAPVNALLLCCFAGHYVQRGILYPYLMPATSKPIPLAVIVSAFLFCSVNGYVQAQSLLQFQEPLEWTSPQLYIGLVLFFTGLTINIHSDAILRQLRARAGTGYQIPRQGGFAYVSAPHFAGELLEWIGFCVACNFSLASVSFVVFTASNLIPRAIAHHAWYRAQFPDYPLNRKALIPFIW